MTRTSQFDFAWGRNLDPTYQRDTKRKLFSLAEVCAPLSAVLVCLCISLWSVLFDNFPFSAQASDKLSTQGFEVVSRRSTGRTPRDEEMYENLMEELKKQLMVKCFLIYFEKFHLKRTFCLIVRVAEFFEKIFVCGSNFNVMYLWILSQGKHQN